MRSKVSIAAAAGQLGCSRPTVRRLIDQGKLEAFKYGDATSRLWITQESVDALLEASRVKTADAQPAGDDATGAVA